jgi:CubicO group peptidase (beta-lactamase class C family)
MTETHLRDGTPEEVGMLPARVAHARDLCARWVEEGHTPTIGVCVARRGVIVLHEAFGVLGPGPDSPPLERDALFPIMSLTKPITATLIMQLVEDGLLGLNRPAKDYLPELSGDGIDAVLVHHLLTHTAGYPHFPGPRFDAHEAKKRKAGFEPPPCPSDQHPAIHEYLSLFFDGPWVPRVGEVMVYSNHNYVLLGEIVRRLGGRAVEAQARQRIFDPLGMRDSYYVVPESEVPRVVQRAPGIPFGPDAAPTPDIGSREWQDTPNTGGGVYSTPLDMVVFGQMFLNRGRYGGARILSPAAVAAMTRDQIPGLGARLLLQVVACASWGYGWQVVSPTKWKYFDGSLQPLGTFGHPGAGGVNYWIDRDHDLVGAYYEVTTRVSADFNLLWNFDLFQNAITAAVDD